MQSVRMRVRAGSGGGRVSVRCLRGMIGREIRLWLLGRGVLL